MNFAKSVTYVVLPRQRRYATFICLEFFTKWPLAAILDDRKSLSITFLAISDQYATFYFFSKWPPAAILDSDFLPKSIGTDLYSM